jgi:RNA polymerase sigma factor (sigma-70 family)
LDELLSGLESRVEPAASDCAQELIRRFTPVVRLVWSTIRSHVEYDDFLQSVFVRAYRNLRGIESTLFPGYFHYVVKSESVDILRRLQRKPPTAEWSEIEDITPSSEDLEREILNALYAASFLRELSPRHQTVLEQMYWKDRTDVEIANLLNLRSAGAVRKLKSKALNELKQIVRSRLAV